MTCTLKAVHSGVLNPTYYREASKGSLTLVIKNLDADAGSAAIEGNNSEAAVEYRVAVDKLQFIETTPVGNLTVTTVFAPPEYGKPMPVAHSRHIAISPANVAISQFAGECIPEA